MEQSERPNKIRKTSHTRDDEVAVASSATTASAPATQQTHQTTTTTTTTTTLESSNPATTTTTAADPTNGAPTQAQDPAVAAESAKTKQEADHASKTTTTTDPPSRSRNATTSSTATSTPADAAGSVSGTAATASPSLEGATTASTNGTGYTGVQVTPGVPLSKNQQKKMRRQAAWDEKKALRKAGRKEENRRKREKKRQERAELYLDPEAFKAQQRSYVPATQLPITLLLDCDFDDKMKDNERVSLAGQITRSYSENKNARFRGHLAVSSFNGKLRERFDGVLNKNYLHWKGFHFLEEDFTVAAEQAKTWMADPARGGELKGVFAKYAGSASTTATSTSTEPATASTDPSAEQQQQCPAASVAADHGEIIYLSSDSDYTLTELKPYSTYIIGGLVDKNREKGLCHRRAIAHNVKTARLPIGDYLEMASRKVLATNHVVEIMLQWLALGDWGEAFMKVIPKRKGGKLRDGRDGDEEEEEDDDDHEEEDEGAEEKTETEADVVANVDSAPTTTEDIQGVQQTLQPQGEGEAAKPAV
ncbi:hypothetical protein AAFC00_006623 [Neodothiora populina]|uniref:tRNA (guanine(9)-N1)-methyltransferase n=1 Tax=Neodothiora populina TaxID=2781224 RepID=A0ABR3PBA0_9PEZI